MVSALEATEKKALEGAALHQAAIAKQVKALEGPPYAQQAIAHSTPSFLPS